MLRIRETLLRGWRRLVGTPQAFTAKRLLGDAGEREAATFLEKSGYEILARNWRSGRDELDLVALGPKQPGGSRPLVFVEVKTRAEADLKGGYHAVDARKRRALRRAVRAYLRAIRRADAPWRFDIVEVRPEPTGAFRVIHHCAVPLSPE